uniref:Uncharacterized protein n=1 Tax=Amphimedon queenslandica TaxID=400682 RepID=A0A1X7UZ18_AMPQE
MLIKKEILIKLIHLISQKECEELLENESSRLLRLDNVRRRQRDYVYYLANEEVQKRWCEILSLKFVTAARILPGSPTTPLSDERVPNSTLDVP